MRLGKRPTSRPRLVTFDVRYRIGEKIYDIELKGMSSAHITKTWDREDATLLRVEEKQ